MLISLVLYRSCESNCNCCELTNAVAVVSRRRSFVSSPSLFSDRAEPWGWGLILVSQLWLRHFVSALRPVVTEKSRMKSEGCTNVQVEMGI